MNELEYIEDDYEVSEVIKGEILNKYIEQNLIGKIEDYERVIDSAMNTVSQFTLVKEDIKKIIKVGLAFGKVQSGKTTYFLCVSACALDNGFDMIIILSGVTKNLLSQNKSRLKKSFKKCKTFLRFYDSSDFANKTKSIIEDIQDDFDSYRSAEINGGVFISVLKEDSHLSKITQIISAFQDKRIMVIDDEGDQFTMNTKVNKDKESTIYTHIRSMIDVNSNLSLLSVTATPQANIFIDIYNELSPDFIELVEPGRDYCGLETFHSNNDYISFVSGDQKLFSNDLRRSIIYYLFTIYETEFNNKVKYLDLKNWMLIHTSRLKTNHLKDFNELNEILDLELMPLINDFNWEHLDIHKTHVVDEIKRAYEDFHILEKFQFTINDFLFHFKDILRLIYTDIDNNNIRIINSDEQDIETEEGLQPTKYGILIGGDMLGRGITISGLTVSYLTRDTITGKGNIDTILQRARWFGYRRELLDLIKIFTTKEIQDKMIDIYHHDVSLYEEIKYCVQNNISIKDSKIPSQITKRLDITRKNVLKKGTVKRLPSSSFMQQRKINASIEYSLYHKVNQLIIQTLSKYRYEEVEKQIKAYRIKSLDLYESLKMLFENQRIYSINERLYDSLIKLLNDNECINVYIIKEYNDDSRGYTVTKESNGVLSSDTVYVGNVLSGSSGEYKGDLYHFNENNHVQIHFTKVKDDNNTYIYSGNKVLFICLNNVIENNRDIIQRR